MLRSKQSKRMSEAKSILLCLLLTFFFINSEDLLANRIMYCTMTGITDLDENGSADYKAERFTASLPSEETGFVTIKGLSFLSDGSHSFKVAIYLSPDWIIFGSVEAGGVFIKNLMTVHSHNLADGVTVFRATCEAF